MDELAKRCHLVKVVLDDMQYPLVEKEQLQRALEFDHQTQQMISNRDFIDYYWS